MFIGVPESGRRLGDMPSTPYGAQSSVAKLRHVLVKGPNLAFRKGHEPEYGFRHPVDLHRAQQEHRAFVQILKELDVKVHDIGSESPSPDFVYQYDPSLVTDRGAILLRSGKPNRLGEEQVQARWYQRNDIPIVGQIEPPGTVDGGDVFWLRPDVVCVGRSLRTNQAGIDQLASMLEGDVHVFDVPYDGGEDDCLHLMSVISPITDHIVVVEPARLPAGLYRLLEALQIMMIGIPPEEVPSLACNVLVIEPGLVVMVEGNTQTQGFLEQQGIEVRTFGGTEICWNGNGGPTCLTRPIKRG